MTGLELSRDYYIAEVRPLLARRFGSLQYSAARIGAGSEVLGLDDAMSTDHDFGPRVMLFVSSADLRGQEAVLREALRQLPAAFAGRATDIPWSRDPSVVCERGIELLTVEGFAHDYLGVDLQAPLTPADWLSVPQHKWLGLTSGEVFHDDLGFESLRARFARYPRDIWLYCLAASWQRVGQEEHLMGRAGFRGDEVGAAIIAARLVQEVMRLGFLMEHRYVPYAKWLGTLFRQLPCGNDVYPVLERVVKANGWRERQNRLVSVLEAMARLHNALGVTPPLDTAARPFFDRPFAVIGGERFAGAIAAGIEDPAVRRLLAFPPIGSVDQFSDSVDLQCRVAWRPLISGLLRVEPGNR